jgi:hypothetical protein
MSNSSTFFSPAEANLKSDYEPAASTIAITSSCTVSLGICKQYSASSLLNATKTYFLSLGGDRMCLIA